MTIDDFWKKYNHCPLCRKYLIQGGACDGCKWMYPCRIEGRDIDGFDPTEDAIRTINAEVTE